MDTTAVFSNSASDGMWAARCSYMLRYFVRNVCALLVLTQTNVPYDTTSAAVCSVNRTRIFVHTHVALPAEECYYNYKIVFHVWVSSIKSGFVDVGQKFISVFCLPLSETNPLRDL